ncbi:DDHD domain-containing protein [Lipomyces oligophaga]|uniref:DDHD domain-containing protein n=1 Tax=Lipomyces oligophaga TaxID=45792 RepID=UPI0034CE90DA
MASLAATAAEKSASAARSLSPAARKSTGQVDHSVPYRQRLSLKDIPADVPPLNVRWHFATDVPRTKPYSGKDWTPPKPPSKFVPFSASDSRSIEALYQRSPNESISDPAVRPELEMVAVNEDRLFRVDIRNRDIGPLYWAGPTYDVRRGTWFYADSSTLKPCDENLANQIEEGYLKIQPFKKSNLQHSSDLESTIVSVQSVSTETQKSSDPIDEFQATVVSQTTNPKLQSLSTEQLDHSITSPNSRSRTSSFTESITSAFTLRSKSPVPKDSSAKSKSSGSAEKHTSSSASTTSHSLQTWPLYGPHMGKYVIYSHDSTTAWIITDDFYGKFTLSIYQRLSSGTSMGGVKLVRGWSDIKAKKSQQSTSYNVGETAVSSAGSTPGLEPTVPSSLPESEIKLSEAIGSNASPISKENLEARDNLELEKQMEKDYNLREDEDQNRPIDHLVLCVHGIGQKLGQRLESVNFVGDINTFRKTLKSVYSMSPNLQALNGETEAESKKVNSRIQVLPVCWRHEIDFGLTPKVNGDKPTKEQDIGDLDQAFTEMDEDDDVVSLQDITVEGVAPLRSIISEVLLDILLYYQPKYREQIMHTVVKECNRIYRSFKEWNPTFKGHVSIAGHSLGSAISFDILCRQPEIDDRQKSGSLNSDPIALDFEVDSYFALGSPIGLFQMLKGKGIAPREDKTTNKTRSTSSVNFDLDIPLNGQEDGGRAVSRPACEDMYNIFYTADPISYRIEPLVVKRMANLKPQQVPAFRRGINNQIADLTSRVAQSASNMWSSVASGLASTILTKSLGYDAAASGSSGGISGGTDSGQSQSLGESPSSPISDLTAQDLSIFLDIPDSTSLTVETLFSKFQQDSVKISKTADHRAKQHRNAELLRGLNYTGRVDFALPEGYMDITLLSSIGSHLSYFRDEDVANFLVSQTLGRPYLKQIRGAQSRQT